MTRVLVAFDKFKDALTARQACEAAAQGLRTKHPDWQLDLCPLTDGGDGFCETLTRAAGGRFESVICTGPRGERINAPIGYVGAEKLPEAAPSRLGLGSNSLLAIIEMASASGLSRLPLDERDPWQTSSYGTGEQIRAALEAGANAILLGVGGSATNDLGFGALAALGFQFLDAQNSALANPIPSTWEGLVRIEGRASLPPVFIACDVNNPLLGPTGAAATFGPQKGLRTRDLPKLEQQAKRLAAMLCDACSRPFSLSEMPGTGAAGGFSFGLMVAAQAKLLPGFDLVSNWLDLPGRVAAADLVLTGEGRFDTTSLGGKGPGSLLGAAKRAGKKVHIFAGSVDLPELNGIKAHAITPASLSLAQALPLTAKLLTHAMGDIF